MQTIRLGGHVFREKASDAEQYPVEQYCVVIAKNLDGTAKLCVFGPNGSQFIIERAEMVELKDDIAAHYEEATEARPAPKSEDDREDEDDSQDDAKPKKTNPKPEKDRGKGASPDEDEDESAPGVKLNPTDRPSTIPGKESLPSVTTPEKGAEHAGIK